MKQIILPFLISIFLISLCFIFFEELEVYFSNLISSSQSETNSYIYLSFLILSSDIVLPVPSSIVMYSNGLILGFLKGMLLSYLSLMVSASIGYWIGFFANIKKGQNYQNKQAQHIIDQYGALGIVITRGIPILSESICITAGFNHMDFKKYFILNAIGFLPICFIYAYFGSIAKASNLFLYSFFASFFLSAMLYFTGRKLFSSKQNIVKQQ